MLTQTQINQFTQRAKQAGYSDEEIAREIERKKAEVTSQSPIPQSNAGGFTAVSPYALENIEFQDLPSSPESPPVTPATPNRGEPATATTPKPSTAKPLNPFGASLEELYRVKSQARAAGDTPAVKEIQGYIDDEEAAYGTLDERQTTQDELTPQRDQEKIGQAKELVTDMGLLVNRRKNIAGAFKGALKVPDQIGPDLLGLNIRTSDLQGKADPDVTAFERVKTRLAYSMAATLANQTGRGLSDKDLKIFLDALPSRSDTEAQFNETLRDVITQFESRMRTAGADEMEITNLTDELRKEAGLVAGENTGISLSDIPGKDTSLSSLPENPPDLEKGFLQQAGEELTSPSTLLSTAGDISGEVAGAAMAPFTFGIINPVTASAGLAAGGEFAGNIIEDITLGQPVDFNKARNQAIEAGVVSGLTPAVFRVGAKVFKPVLFVPGKFIEQYLGKQLTALGNQATKKLAGEGLDRGIKIYDEVGLRGLGMLNREEALKVINTTFKTQEEKITQAIAKAGNPAVMTGKQLKEIVENEASRMLQATDKEAILNLGEDIFKQVGENKDVLADGALKLKRDIFKKAGGTSAVNKAKRRIAYLANDALQTKIPQVVKSLREQEIAYLLEDLFKNLRNVEYAKGLDFNAISPIRSIINLTGKAGKTAISALGAGSYKAGKVLRQLPIEQGFKKAENATRFIRQPARNFYNILNKRTSQEQSLPAYPPLL